MALLNHWYRSSLWEKSMCCSLPRLMIQAWRCTKPGIWSQMKTDLHLNTSSWPHAKLISIYTVEEHRYLERDCWQTASSSQAERYPREIILSQERKELQIFNVFTIRFTFCMQHLQKPGSIQLESKAIATHDLKTSVGLSKNTVERLKTGQEKGKWWSLCHDEA